MAVEGATESDPAPTPGRRASLSGALQFTIENDAPSRRPDRERLSDERDDAAAPRPRSARPESVATRPRSLASHGETDEVVKALGEAIVDALRIVPYSTPQRSPARAATLRAAGTP
jgi:hypothetical protein